MENGIPDKIWSLLVHGDAVGASKCAHNISEYD